MFLPASVRVYAHSVAVTGAPHPAWSTDLFADYVLVTTQEIEFYKLAASKVAKKPVKTIAHLSAFQWFLPAAQFLLVIDQRSTFQGFALTPDGATRVPFLPLRPHPFSHAHFSRMSAGLGRAGVAI